jgi:hypothetical protein
MAGSFAAMKGTPRAVQARPEPPEFSLNWEGAFRIETGVGYCDAYRRSIPSPRAHPALAGRRWRAPVLMRTVAGRAQAENYSPPWS